MNYNQHKFLFCLLIFIITVACNNNGKEVPKENINNKNRIATPNFSADSAYYWIEQQVAFGPRVPNTEAHQKCGDYLVAELKRFTSEVIEQKFNPITFDGKKLQARNIIASFQPEKKNRIFVAAHWDSRPFCDYDPDKNNHDKPVLGANDGASGVGVILEIARQLSQTKPSIGVDLILFDAEDYGQRGDRQGENQKEDTWCLGSQYWSKNPHKENYYASYGILLDMVGAKGATFGYEGTSMYYAPNIVRKVWDIAAYIGYESYFVREQRNSLTDDHLYINKLKGIPTIDIIHQERQSPTGFFPQWHTTKDDMSNIDKNTLKAVGQTVLETIFREGNEI